MLACYASLHRSPKTSSRGQSPFVAEPCATEDAGTLMYVHGLCSIVLQQGACYKVVCEPRVDRQGCSRLFSLLFWMVLRSFAVKIASRPCSRQSWSRCTISLVVLKTVPKPIARIPNSRPVCRSDNIDGSLTTACFDVLRLELVVRWAIVVAVLAARQILLSQRGLAHNKQNQRVRGHEGVRLFATVLIAFAISRSTRSER